MSKAYLKLTHYKLKIEKLLSHWQTDYTVLKYEIYSHYNVTNSYFSTVINEWETCKLLYNHVTYRTPDYNDIFMEKQMELYSLNNNLYKQYNKLNDLEKLVEDYNNNPDRECGTETEVLKLIYYMKRFFYKMKKYVFIATERLERRSEEYEQILNDIDYEIEMDE